MAAGTLSAGARLSFLIILALAACQDAVSPEQALPGRYSLLGVNGSPLPYSLFDMGTQKVEIIAGELQINTDMTFSRSLTIHTTDNGSITNETRSESGSWTITGNQVGFTSTEGAIEAGQLNGNVLAVVAAGISYVFQK